MMPNCLRKIPTMENNRKHRMEEIPGYINKRMNQSIGIELVCRTCPHSCILIGIIYSEVFFFVSAESGN